ncbi:MAG: amino acid transporter ATPase [Pseudomonadota bacterium]|jgi:branched-chain amino acid transport system ATP-binding protein
MNDVLRSGVNEKRVRDATESAGQLALSVEGLSVNYGGIRAVRGISLTVGRGEIVTLIGANGAGKSSTLRGIVRLLRAEGRVSVFGTDVSKLEANQVAALGVALVPEGRGVFTGLTVLENLELGSYLKRERTGLEARLSRVLQLFPRLGERFTQDAGTLSGGEQQMLAIGRALMADPRIILLDEPSLGLSPKLVGEIFSAIRSIAAGGLTILLVEQNTRLALETAQRAYVLATGEIVLSGSAAELRDDPRIKEAYLGGSVR